MVVVVNIRVLTHVRKLFNVDYMPREINRANQLKWVRAVRRLGNKWLIIKPVERKNESQP